jgi:hypothetical protein
MLRTIAGAVVGEVIGQKRGHGLLGAGLGIIATRIATRSLPGALLVGGALVAKAVYDRRKASRYGGQDAALFASVLNLTPLS